MFVHNFDVADILHKRVSNSCLNIWFLSLLSNVHAAPNTRSVLGFRIALPSKICAGCQ